jgi:hypothetical protein
MARPLAFTAGVLAALLLVPAATAGVSFGVTDDGSKYAADGGTVFFGQLQGAGMKTNAITVQWDPAQYKTIEEQKLLDKTVAIAKAKGIELVFAVYPMHGYDVSNSEGRAELFAAFVAQLARRYPSVTEFVIGNEPNQPRFWQPQFYPDGTDAVAPTYEQALADSYDALKSVNPAIRVIGIGLSGHGNDDPGAASNASISPLRFLHDLGVAYRASGRKTPLMDALAVHLYPTSNTDPPFTPLAWPDAGLGQLDRVKQGVWDAFAGTAQPTFESGLTMWLTETGWQVGIAPSAAGSYQGVENVKTTDEQTQASIYAELVRKLPCDATLTHVLFFELVDDVQLTGFQSGLVRADGTLRPAYGAVSSALAQTGGGCGGTPAPPWHHATTVIGAAAVPAPLRQATAALGPEITISAEDASFTAKLVARDEPGAPAVFSTSGTLHAGRPLHVRAATPLAPHTYAWSVVMTATLNPQRTSSIAGRPFQVLKPR